jgi:hypothetical protein
MKPALVLIAYMIIMLATAMFSGWQVSQAIETITGSGLLGFLGSCATGWLVGTVFGWHYYQRHLRRGG